MWTWLSLRESREMRSVSYLLTQYVSHFLMVSIRLVMFTPCMSRDVNEVVVKDGQKL